jgi:Acetyltransferase (GNAT) domain
VGWRTEERRWRRVIAVGVGYGAEDDEGALVGTAVLNRFDGVLATIAMMVVAPQMQRQGLGRRLMDAALSHVGDEVVYLYATDMGRPLYDKLGFVLDGTATERLEGAVGIRSEAYDGLRPMRAADFPGVHALDAQAQGASRGPLLEALSSLAERAVVVERDGDVAGFGLASLVDGTRLIGPVVAEEAADAHAIASALAADTPEPVRVELDPGDQALRAWGRGVGLVSTGTNGRMVLGGRPLPGRRSLVRAMAGRAYG